MPAFLVTSTLAFYGSTGVAATLGALIGAQVGFGILMLLLMGYDRAHAGLPPIVACTLLGWWMVPVVV